MALATGEKITVREAAQAMDCTLKYVFDLLYANKLKGARKVGRVWKIPVESIEERLRQRENRNN